MPGGLWSPNNQMEGCWKQSKPYWCTDESWVLSTAPGSKAISNRIDVLDQPPPSTIRKARSDSEAHGYLAALYRELDAFKRRGATEVPENLDIHNIPPELILQLMPLFSKKYEGMNFSKFKCRMVVLGNKWKNEHGIDTFSDMVHMDTLKILLAMAASADWEICKIDVAEAFLTTQVNKRYPSHISKHKHEDMYGLLCFLYPSIWLLGDHKPPGMGCTQTPNL